MGGVRSTVAALAASAAMFAIAWTGLGAQRPPAYDTDPNSVPGANGASGADLGLAFFATADANVDNTVSLAELTTALERFLADGDAAQAGSVTVEQLQAGVKFRQPRLPQDSHVRLMEAALPAQLAAKPARAHRILVMDYCGGFIHTPIPLTNRMIETFGTRNKLWTTTASWDPADINAENLKQYDAIVLNSTTGRWLDDPNDAAVTEARRKALLDFVRSGKGLVGIHGTGDSYHQNDPALAAARAGNGGGGGRAGRGGRGGNACGPACVLATGAIAQGDRNADQKIDKGEMQALAGSWFAKLDTDKKGAVGQTDFINRIGAVVNPNPAPRGGGAGRAARSGAAAAGAMAGMNMGEAPARGGAAQDLTPDIQRSLWQDYSNMIGGFFKFHFPNTLITIKVDDPNSPLTSMLKGQPPLKFYGEVYTFGMDTWSRRNLHVLTSVDYDKVSDEDKAKEPNPRSDHDYALSWIRREGQGRVFYFALGNEERVFFSKPFNEQFLAGIQYALGDLKADDSPSAK
jgi:type 1 glutamine amidotransferase